MNSQRKKRICHLAKYYPPHSGGIETHVQNLARAQAQLGAKVTVVCVNGFNKNEVQARRTKTFREIDENVQVIRLGRLFPLPGFDFCPGCFPELWRLLHQNYDVIHIHTPNPTMLIAWIIISFISWVIKKSTVTLIITHHSDIIKQRLLKYVIRPLEYFVYCQASLILTDSPRYFNGSKFLQAFKHKVKVLPLGLDCSTYLNPPREALSYARYLKEKYQGPIWLCVGRLVYYKALDVAIEALGYVSGTLIFIGIGPMEKELKTKAQQLGLSKRIVWHGRASEIELIGAYHAANALWFPSNRRSEGFGLVQVEAMASGCPVINANIPCSGVTWVSRHEREGLTVPLNDPAALAFAAKRLLTEPGLYERLVKGGRDRIETEFDHMIMGQRSLQVYQQAEEYELREPSSVWT